MGEFGRDADEIEDVVEPPGADYCVISFRDPALNRSRSPNLSARASRRNWTRSEERCNTAFTREGNAVILSREDGEGSQRKRTKPQAMLSAF